MRFIFSFLISALLCSAGTKPNVIIIFTDDQGYNDLGSFGSKSIKTPHLDRMATEGRKFTSFYVASPVCTPSRAALLTACYPKRISLAKGVIFPKHTHGLHPDEYTLADHFSSHGYNTACIGKWHLGHLPEVLPRAQGFHSYFGIPYSNDMHHPDNTEIPKANYEQIDAMWNDQQSTFTSWNTPLIENEKIVELPVDQRTITRRYTDKAIGFIKTSAKARNPFFLYLPHSMPHIPLYVPDEFSDRDPKQAYTRVIEHLDEEVGRILNTLRESKLEKNTLVIFTSDNGPWLRFKHHAGSAKPLRGGKMTNFEGGQRVPCLMWWPGRIPANSSSNEFLSTLDLLPSLAALTRTELPQNHSCDGHDAAQTILSDQPSPRKELVYYSSQGSLTGIRRDNWKLLRLQTKAKGPGENLLFDLAADLAETTNLATQHPGIVKELVTRLNEIDKEITRNQRPVWKAVKK